VAQRFLVDNPTEDALNSAGRAIFVFGGFDAGVEAFDEVDVVNLLVPDGPTYVQRISA